VLVRTLYFKIIKIHFKTILKIYLFYIFIFLVKHIFILCYITLIKCKSLMITNFSQLDEFQNQNNNAESSLLVA
jgi:hypothetical protein